MELSRAMALIRPQAPAWSFAPLPLVDPTLASVGGRHEGDVLVLDVDVTLVKRRAPGEGV